MKDGRLTAKQERFVLEYLVSLNATQAAILAGYSKKTAKDIGSENLAKPLIRARIDEQLKKIESAKIADAKEVLQLLTAAARGEMEEQVVSYTPQGELDLVTKKIGGRDKVKAVELLGKHHGLFVESLNINEAPKVVIHVRSRDKH